MTQLQQKLTTLSGAGNQEQERDPIRYTQELLASKKNLIAQVIPKALTPERFSHLVLNAVRTTPKLRDCTQESFLGGVVQSCLLGLEPNTVQGHAYLIPFWNSRKKVYEAQFIAGYRGLVELARRSGTLRSISAQVVRIGDEFAYEFGTQEFLRHIPRGEFDESAEITHAYAIATLDSGYKQFIVMRRGEVLKIRNNSHGYRAAVKAAERYDKPVSSPWVDWEDQMFAKTAVRRLYKLLPTSTEMIQAAALDDLANSGQDQELGRVLEGEIVDHAIAPELEAGEVDPGPAPGEDPDAGLFKVPDSVGDIDLDDDHKAQAREHGYFRYGSDLINLKGEVFHGDKHVQAPSGAPILNQDGTFRKRPQRKPTGGEG